ncbi:MAG: ankyrin repeat domain-containing protein [Candidatus Aminicenantes bacterium]|nr:MAG: ankyrin repeat domain-containing protein [Candidatus Aminicenantes bacterium]
MRLIPRIIVLIGIIFSAVFSYTQDIYIASYRGDLETVKRWIEENPELVNSRNSNGRFPLEMAAQTGQIEIVKYLLEKGADVNLNRGGATALHMAALYGGKTELITLLLEAGADINAKTGDGVTPLNLAVIGKQKDIAELLLDKGGEMNLENQNFTQLLYISASCGIKRIADIALKKEVDFLFRTGNGDTMLHAASEGGMSELARLLLSKGVNMEAANIYGQTPLHIAARGGYKNIVELFLKNNADINVKTKDGKTPYHYAKEKGHNDIVDFLKEKGADTSEWMFPKLAGKYLGQSPPGEDPVIFSSGIVSAQKHFEHSCLAFSPDYTEIYWSSDFTEFGFYDIVYMKKENNLWSAPKLAPFSEKYHAGSPVFSYDGEKLYFSSPRPRYGDVGTSDTNIWVVEKVSNGWSEPKLLDAVINSDQRESVQSISKKGTLYFRCGMEMFSSKQKNAVFQTPEKLDLKLGAGARVLALFVAPDENYMIMESFGGEGGYGGADLYISYKLKDGSWSEPANLGPKINTGATERFPSVTPDGKYLFFLRVTDGSDFYWVSAKIIEELRPEELGPSH